MMIRPSVRPVLALTVALALLTPSSSEAQSAELGSPPSEYRLRDVEIVFARLGCGLGRCPVYKLSLQGNGTGLYEGERYVRTRGPRQIRIGEASFRSLLQDFYDSRFFELTGADLMPLELVGEPRADGYIRVQRAQTVSLDSEEISIEIRIGRYIRGLGASRGHSLAAERLFSLAAAIDVVARSEDLVGFRQTTLAAHTRRREATPTQEQLVPSWVTTALMKSGILNTHEFETSINPFLQRGDFDGDGKVDFAAWVTKRDGWDLGLVFVHRVSGKVTIVGSGSPIPGVGESDLTWADAWSVFEKGIVTTTRGAGPAPLLRGDAILLVNTEGAGGILWWTGKNYSWYTQGNEPPWRD